MPEFIRKAKEFSDDYKAQGAYLKKLLKVNCKYNFMLELKNTSYENVVLVCLNLSHYISF